MEEEAEEEEEEEGGTGGRWEASLLSEGASPCPGAGPGAGASPCPEASPAAGLGLEMIRDGDGDEFRSRRGMG